MKTITGLTAAALLVAGIGFASAQGTSSPTADSGSKCWDQATNTARDKMPTTGAATTGASSIGTTGSKAAAPAGSAPTTGMAPAPAAPGAGTTAVRPAGMQNC